MQRFDPATALESIRQRGVTVIPGAPPMWVAFAHFDEAPADSFAGVRLALSGAAKLPVAAAERMRERFGVEIAEGYGLTEAAPIVTSSAGLAPRFGSIGKVLTGVELRLVGDDGEDVHRRRRRRDLGARRQRVRRLPRRSARRRHACSPPTAGCAPATSPYCDDAGYLWLVDRAKDLVIVSGFNVFPAEVEDVLVAHPDVAEVGVIGVPHPHTGEAVKAFVVLEPGATLDEEALIDYAHDHLARYKCPSKVVFVDELPRNASGKLVRRDLEGMFAAG